MRTEVYPDFFFRFECIADRCRHTCCAGWEIDVDRDTAEYYKRNEDLIGKKYEDVIMEDEDGCHFILTEGERCPFLREDGLCRIIKALGEEALCDICALHPRFYEEYDGYELNGLGLCCEAVCDLLWETDDRLSFLCSDGGKYSHPVFDESFTPVIDDEYIRRLLLLFMDTEPIDDDWTKEIKMLLADEKNVIKRASDHLASYDKKRYDRMYHYIMYRQLFRLSEDGMDIKKLLRYGYDATLFVFITDAYFSDTKECMRRFSEQIEYSTENVDILFG